VSTFELKSSVTYREQMNKVDRWQGLHCFFDVFIFYVHLSTLSSKSARIESLKLLHFYDY